MEYGYMLIAILAICNIVMIMLKVKKRTAEENHFKKNVEIKFDHQKQDIQTLEKHLHDYVDDYIKHLKKYH